MRASGTDRAITCPSSLVEPERLTRRTASAAAAGYGTLGHWWKQHGNLEMLGASQVDTQTFERKILLSGVDRETLWSGGEHEVTFALGLDGSGPYLYDAARQKITADEWKKSFTGAWLTGTIDYWSKELAWIDDLKCGRWPVDPRTSGQLKSYALLPWFLDGRPARWSYRVSITHWPKYPINKPPQRTGVSVSGLDMIEHLDALNHAYESPEEYNPGVRLGWDPTDESSDCCVFCPSREPFPASEWMQSVWHRALPSCARGLAKLARSV